MTATNPATRGARPREGLSTTSAKSRRATVPTAHDAPLTFDEPGYLVSSPCGRQWFVALAAVAHDYADFLREVDGLTAEQAAAKVADNAEFVPTWFAEQFTCWEDVERRGRLVTGSARFKTKAALDRCRGSYRNAEYVSVSPAALSRRDTT